MDGFCSVHSPLGQQTFYDFAVLDDFQRAVARGDQVFGVVNSELVVDGGSEILDRKRIEAA